MTVIDESVAPPPPPPPPRPTPYSFWQTIGLFALIFALQNIVGGLVAVAFAIFTGHADPATMADYVQSLVSNGFFVGVSTLATAPLCIGLIVLFASLRRGLSFREYLALRPVPAGIIALSLGAVVVFALLLALVNSLAHHPEVSQFGIDTYRTAGSLPLLLVAFVVLAPVFEELLFRGLLFRGLAASAMGGWGAVVFTAMLFAALHLQYDAFEIASIFALGVVLGAVRLKTNSVYPCIAMHAFTNLVSTIEVIVKVHGG